MRMEHYVEYDGADRLWPDIEARMASLSPPGSVGARDGGESFQEDLDEPGARRVFSQTYLLLSSAYEHHCAFKNLVSVMGVTPRAPFNLLRPILEASLWALWILDPEDVGARRERALRFEVLDYKAELVFLEDRSRMDPTPEVLDHLERRRGQEQELYGYEAELMGLDLKKLKSGRLNMIATIPTLERLKKRADGESEVLAIVKEWRRLSGYQHGAFWALYYGSNVNFTSDIPGGADAAIEASQDSISEAVWLSSLVFLEAITLYSDRC